MCGKWHLGTDEYHPTNHGFDYYYGAHMTQNECVSNIVSPGAALVAGVNVRNSSGTKYGSIYGACPIFNGSTAVPSIQRNMLATPPRLFDMNDVDELYDEASLPDNSVTHPPYLYDGRVCLTALRHTPALPLRRACRPDNSVTHPPTSTTGVSIWQSGNPCHTPFRHRRTENLLEHPCPLGAVACCSRSRSLLTCPRIG